MSSSSSGRSIIESVRISDVYHALTGRLARRTGGDHFRCPATWRGGDGLTVSLDDAKNVWHDPKASEGGGVLDLVTRVRGGSHQEALRWLADLAGVPLDDSPVSTEDRKAWAAQRRAIERDLPAARLWRRAAIMQGDELLSVLKAAIFDPTADVVPGVGEIAHWERQLDRWRRIDGAELVTEYQDWRARDPKSTEALVCFARSLEAAEVRAVVEYVRQLEEATP